MTAPAIGAPGSVARMLSESPRRFGWPFVVFRYDRDGITALAVQETRELAERFLVDDGRHVVVDVRGYGCPVPDHACAEPGCTRLAYTGDAYCATCSYIGGHPMPSLAP